MYTKTVHSNLDKEKNGYEARDQLLYGLAIYSEGLDSCQGSLVWHQHEATWEQGPTRALVSFTLGLIKKLFVSYNHTLIIFYFKKPYPSFFSALPTPDQRKTCIKHTFLTKKKNPPKIYIIDLPTLFIFWTVTGNKFFFLGLKEKPDRQHELSTNFGLAI